MQFYKRKQQKNAKNEYIKLINSIESDEINNVCFECGTNDPEYISINNGVFICKECVQDHFQFPREISTIMLNDLCSLNINELKKLYLGGNKKLIEFINYDFPRLKQFPPNILYKTRAIDYYRKRLQFFVQGGIRPLKPIFEYAYQLINIPKNNFNNNIRSTNGNYRKDLYFSPKVNIPNERINNINVLTPISESNQLEDEKDDNNSCSYSEEEKEHNQDKINNTQIILSPNALTPNMDGNFIYSPKKPKSINNTNNNSAFICSNNSHINKSAERDKHKGISNTMTNFLKNPLNILYKKHALNSFQKSKNANGNGFKSDDSNAHIHLNDEKNISEIINVNNNEKSGNILNDDNFGDDNTIKVIDRYINSPSPKKSDSSTSRYIKEKEKDKDKENTHNENSISQFVPEKIEEINISCVIDDIKKTKDEEFKDNKENNKENNKESNKKNNKEINKDNNNKIKNRTESEDKNEKDQSYKNNKNNKDIIDKKLDLDIKENKNETLNYSNNNKNNYKNNNYSDNKESKLNSKENNKNDYYRDKNNYKDNDNDSEKYKNDEKYEIDNKVNKTYNFINNNGFEDDFTKNIKVAKVIYPKDFDTYSEKEKYPKRRFLRAKVSTKQTIDDDEEYGCSNYDDYYPKRNSYLKKDDFFQKPKTNTITNTNVTRKKEKKPNFYSDASSSGFINPLKYLKKSFQKKQEEKFGFDNDDDSNSKSYEEENENEDNHFNYKNNNKNRNNSFQFNYNNKYNGNSNKDKNLNDYKKSRVYKVFERNNIQKDEMNNKNENKKKEINENDRTKSSFEKGEGDTNECTESQQDEKNANANSIRRKYKNRRTRY